MPTKPYIISLVALICAICVVAALSVRSVPAVVQTNLERLPMVIAGYTGTDDAFPDAVYRELNADKNVYRHYMSTNGNQIDLYIGYYGTAKGGRTGHNPYACLPGSGAAIVGTGTVYLKQAATGRNVPVNYILSRKDGNYLVMLHWYQTAGSTVVANGLQQNMERFKGMILHNRNDGAFVRVTAAADGQDITKVKERVAQFADAVLNLLPAYWPVEK